VSEPGADEVYLIVPPFASCLRTIRLVAADAAGRAGLDIEEVEEFRLAVDELSRCLMAVTDCSIVVSVWTDPDGVAARGTARRRAGALPPADPEGLADQILSSVTDHYELTVEPEEIAFVVVKRRERQPS
jgi:hypothetical protein